MEPLKCGCKYHNILAECDKQGNIYIQCRGCKEKVKIEPIKEPTLEEIGIEVAEGFRRGCESHVQSARKIMGI